MSRPVTRQIAFSLFVTALCLGAAGLSTPVASVAAASVSAAIPVDRQNYVSDLPQDPYAGSDGHTPPSFVPDGSEIHVGWNANQETARGFFHLELEAVAPGSTLTGGAVRFKTNSTDNSSVDLKPDTSQLKICLLKAELPNSFDPKNPPPFDCAVSSKGKLTTEPAPKNATTYVYTFDLAPLLAKWTPGQNTGAAIVPDSPAASDSWAVGFDKSLSGSVVEYLMPATTTPISYSTQPQPQAYTTLPQPQAAVPAPVTYPNSPPAETNPAPVSPTKPQQAAPPASTPTTPVNGFPLWLVILVCALGVSVALVGQSLAKALSRGGGLRGMMVPLRAHPRVFYIAAVLTVWSVGYSVYAAANGQVLPKSGQVATGASPTPTDSGLSVSTSPSATAAPGSLAATLPEHPIGTVHRIGNTSVVVPAGGGPPVADLFGPTEDTVGMSANQINICSHAALIFGPALHLAASDLHVFWQNLNEHGPFWIKNAGYKGIYGKSVDDTYFDDQYKPGNAVQAAQNCHDQLRNGVPGTFFLGAGFGFDQIPAVRIWAEQTHTLYYHHMATGAGTAGLRYSFTYMPTVENLGNFLGQYADSKFHGHTFGVIYRNSTNWSGGSNGFKSYMESHGNKVAVYDAVNNNQGNYATEINDMKMAGVDTVMVWENATASPAFIKQAQQQQLNARYLVASFDIVPQTVSAANGNAPPPPMEGFGAWPAYACSHPAIASAAYAPYASDIQEFEREYQQYDPNTYPNLCGQQSTGGDLLYGAWAMGKQIAQMLIDCGPNCTRNRLAGMLLTGYKQSVPPNCPQDWSRKQRLGDYAFNITSVFQNPNDQEYDVQPAYSCRERYP